MQHDTYIISYIKARYVSPVWTHNKVEHVCVSATLLWLHVCFKYLYIVRMLIFVSTCMYLWQKRFLEAPKIDLYASPSNYTIRMFITGGGAIWDHVASRTYSFPREPKTKSETLLTPLSPIEIRRPDGARFAWCFCDFPYNKSLGCQQTRTILLHLQLCIIIAIS